jgi:hypothetical protein
MVAGAYAATEVCFRAVPAGAPRCVVVPDSVNFVPSLLALRLVPFCSVY